MMMIVMLRMVLMIKVVILTMINDDGSDPS